MTELKENQKIKVKADHKFHGGKEGYFRNMNGKNKDCAVCSLYPVANGGWNIYFVVGLEDLEDATPKEQ